MHAAVAIQAVRAAVNLKTMQVPIFPAEGDLQYGVQLGDRVVASNQPPPNQRADAAQYRAQLIKAIPGGLTAAISKEYACAPITPKFWLLSLLIAYQKSN